MKINGVIIMNRMNLNEFFDFKEFWKKRQEFISSVKPDIFFESTSCEQYRLFTYVKNWITGKLGNALLVNGASLTDDYILLKNDKIRRKNTLQCKDLLDKLPATDVFGLVALYEMIGRDLKGDIDDVLASFGIDNINWTANFISVQPDREYELPVLSEPVKESKPADLRNVLIVNITERQNGYATVVWNGLSVRLGPNECCRAIFYDEYCLWLMPSDCADGYKFSLSGQKKSTVLYRGEPVNEPKCIISVAADSNGVVYLTDSKENPCVAHHSRIDDSELNYILGKDEKPVYVLLSPSGNETLLLTNKKKLYRYSHRDNDAELHSTDVLMVQYNHGKMEIRKLIK